MSEFESMSAVELDRPDPTLVEIEPALSRVIVDDLRFVHYLLQNGDSEEWVYSPEVNRVNKTGLFEDAWKTRSFISNDQGDPELPKIGFSFSLTPRGRKIYNVLESTRLTWENLDGATLTKYFDIRVGKDGQIKQAHYDIKIETDEGMPWHEVDREHSDQQTISREALADIRQFGNHAALELGGVLQKAMLLLD